MNKLYLISAIACVLSCGQILGQTTTTTTKTIKTETTTPVSQPSNRNGKTETITRTVTINSNGDSTATITRTFSGNMKTSLGIKANVGFSNFVIRDMPDCRSNMGFSMLAGGFIKLESRCFALQYELLVRYRSSETEDTIMQNKTNYQYWGLELPIYVMGQIHTKAGKIFIGAGPYVSFGIDAKQTPENVNLYRKKNATGKAVMHRWDFGIGTMLGFEFNNGISLNAGCYQGGVVNVLSAEKGNKSMKNQAVNFGIGYKF
ncbi:MAG: PorT family protein [Lentimicrobiaceae bacterium]|nr:PorT family protein [Lentimicrobiaceae bacterium]